MERVDCIVVGAGVVGLACARQLAAAGREVIVVERHDVIGAEISSRNSEVIHAGIYYPHDSLKARLCVAGKRLLYAYCRNHHVPHRRCGKIIVATSAQQLPALADYRSRAQRNGVHLKALDAAAVRELEPEVHAIGGLLSESTGIVDAHALMISLRGDLERAGGVVAFNTEVRDLRYEDGIVVETDSLTLTCGWLVNCAGLAAPDLARRLWPPAPRAFYARGQYFSYSGTSPFSRLVYPLAEPGGLGIHVTLDLAGVARFGPDVVWLDAPDYSFDHDRLEVFADAVRRYYPALDQSRLVPGYTGIRPKIVGPGLPDADFRIDGPDAHGIEGLINLLGIESPGLTASLAIAELVTREVT